MIEPRLDEPDGPRPWWARVGWMIAYWAASIAVLGVVAMLLRWWIN